MSARGSFFRRASWALLAALLSSCGGGGGGGGASGASGGSGGGGRPPPSLIPTPAPLGAVLATDALQLRPTTAGAVWTYRGHETRFAGATPTVYSNVVTQSAQTGGFDETSTNVFNAGNDSAVIVLGPDSVTTDGDLELRSPVQQNDQYTLFSEHVADIGVDVDGDGRNDAGDVAIYRVVVGLEQVAPENLPALQAVRVDTVGLSRVTLTSDGSTSPAVEVVRQSTWYAAGIGIVRQRLTVLNASGSEQVNDETIVSFDGLDRGFGATAPVAATVPASSPTMPGAAIRGGNDFVGAARLADHALVFTTLAFPEIGTMVSRMDRRGHVLGTQLVAARFSSLGRVAGLTTGAAYVEPINALAAQAALTRFDADGGLVGAVAGKTIELGGGRFNPVLNQLEAVGDGDTLWILWSRRYQQLNPFVPMIELVLGTFDADGNPTAPEVVLDSSLDSGEVFGPAISAQAGGVVLSWKKNAGSNTSEARYALARTAPGNSVNLLLAVVPGSNVFVEPVALGQGGALAWQAALGTGASLPQVAGVRLTDSGSILRSAANLDAELTSVTLSIQLSNNVLRAAAAGNRVVFTRSGRGQLWADEPGTSDLIDRVAWLDADPATALALAPARSVRAGSGGAYAQVVWPDRVLLLGGANNQLTARVVWLNSGS